MCSSDLDKWCPLLFAAKEGHHEIIAELLDHGAAVNYRDLVTKTIANSALSQKLRTHTCP